MGAGGGRGPQWLRAEHLGMFAVLTLPGIGMAQQAMPGKKLTGSSAWLKLVGNTLTGKVDGGDRCGKPAQRKELHQAAAATISDQLETCSAATSFHRGPEARKKT